MHSPIEEIGLLHSQRRDRATGESHKTFVDTSFGRSRPGVKVSTIFRAGVIKLLTQMPSELSEDDGAYIRFYLDNAKADMQDLALLEDIAQLEKVAQEMVPDKSLESECPICEDVLEYIPSEDQPWGSLRCGSWHTWSESKFPIVAVRST